MLNFFISYSVYFFSLTYLCTHISKSKIPNRNVQYLIGELFAIGLLLATSSTVSFHKTILMTIVFFIYIILCYKFTIISAVLELLLMIILCSSAELIANYILNIFIDLSYLNNINSFGYFLVTILSGAVLFLFTFATVKIINGLEWETFPKYIYLIFILPFATALLFLNLNNYVEIIQNDFILVLCLIFLVAANFILLSVFVKIINVTNKMNEINSKKELYILRYEYLTKLYNHNFNYMHHIIRKLMKIQNSFTDENIDIVKAQLFELNQEILKSFNIINTGSSIISPILNSFADTIISDNISFTNILEYDDFYFLSLNDQRELFNDLLEIGLMNCKACQSTDKIMILKSVKENNHVLIQLIFSKANSKLMEGIDKYNELEKIVLENKGILTLDKAYNEGVNSLVVSFFIADNVK